MLAKGNLVQLESKTEALLRFLLPVSRCFIYYAKQQFDPKTPDVLSLVRNYFLH